MLRAHFIFLLGALLFLASCRAAVRPEPGSPKHAVIFVPGYKGSTLTDKRGKRIWITLSEALFGRTTLAVDEANPLTADSVLRSVALFPGFDFNAYGAWMRWLEESIPSDAAFIPLAYDWRLDHILAVRKLADTVRSLRSKGVERVDVIGHSMGALVLAYYLRYGSGDPGAPSETWEGAMLVNRAVLTGSPFSGTMKILRDFMRSQGMLFNNKLLSWQAVGTFPAAYELLPQSGKPLLLDSAGAPLDLNWFSFSVWEDYRWGLADNRLDERGRGELRELLEKGQHFLAALRAPLASPPAAHRARLLAIRGRGIATEEKCVVFSKSRAGFVCNSSEARKSGRTLPPGFAFGEGDGVVTSESAELPQAFLSALGAEQIDVPFEHAGMLLEQRVRDAIQCFLDEDTAR